jgi:ribose 5-phosphate isomerase B
MRVAVASDHGGYPLKAGAIELLASLGHDVTDVGAYGFEPLDDYPDFALAIAQAVAGRSVERGVLICGSGVGASIAANKLPGVRAAVCHDTYSAHQGVEHDDMNILCLGARVIGPELAAELIRAFITAQFSNGERHVRRLQKVAAIEQRYMAAQEVQHG